MKPYQTILAPTDFSDVAELGVNTAMAVANQVNAERLHVLHVVRSLSLSPGALLRRRDLAGRIVRELTANAEQRIRELTFQPIHSNVTTEVVLGTPAEQIKKSADRNHADLIVLSSHGRGAVGRFVVGSVANTLLRSADCPLLIVGPERPAKVPFVRVLAAVDASGIAPHVLAHAMLMAAPNGVVHVLSAHEIPDAPLDSRDVLPHYLTVEEKQAMIDQYREAIQIRVEKARTAKVEVTVEISAKSPPADAILDAVKNTPPDLLVIGTSGRNAWSRVFLGSTATRVVNEAPCPVLVVPFESSM